MASQDLDRWASTAKKLLTVPNNPQKTSLDIAFQEAVRAALFLNTYWKPQGKLPGLEGTTSLTLEASAELISIVRAVQQAQLELWLEQEIPPLVDELHPEKRARKAITELDAVFDHLLKSTLAEEERSMLQRATATRETERRGENPLQVVLMSYADTAERLRPRLEPLAASFDLASITEARALIEGLDIFLIEEARAQERREARRKLFYQLLSLMQARVQQIRTAATFVFRKRATILRQVTSAHQRKRRAQQKRKKK
jgi:hypothetical protein